MFCVLVLCRRCVVFVGVCVCVGDCVLVLVCRCNSSDVLVYVGD